MELSASYRPFRGAYVRDKVDALILCQAASVGRVDQASQRLSIQQRKQLSISGALFIFEKGKAEMERWTDGRAWSRSRQLPDKFFVYYEDVPGSASTTSAGLNSEDSSIPRRTKRGDPADQVGAIVGPLRFMPGFSTTKLIKKTITISMPATTKQWHVISYFTVDEVLSGQMPAVRDHPAFVNIQPVQDGSYSIPEMLPSPQSDLLQTPMKYGRSRSSTWSNGSASPAPPLPHDTHSRQISCPRLSIHTGRTIIAPPRLDSLPRAYSYHDVIPVNDGLASGPVSPTRRSSVPVVPLDMSGPISPTRRASAPNAMYTLSHSGHSGASSPVDTNFNYSPMPFQIPTLYSSPFAGSLHHNALYQVGLGAYPHMVDANGSTGSPQVHPHSNLQSPMSATFDMTDWIVPEPSSSDPLLSPSACFDFEAYLSSMSQLTPDEGSQHSSPTMPDPPTMCSAPASGINPDIDPHLQLHPWSYDPSGMAEGMHEQITPKAFEHGHGQIMYGDEHMHMGGEDNIMMVTPYNAMQWMTPDCHSWPTHA